MNTASHLFTLSNPINSLSKTKPRSCLENLSLKAQLPNGSMGDTAPAWHGFPSHEFSNAISASSLTFKLLPRLSWHGAPCYPMKTQFWLQHGSHIISDISIQNKRKQKYFGVSRTSQDTKKAHHTVNSGARTQKL